MDSALITIDTKVEPTTLQAKKPFPVIPVEIVAKILNNLRNDKHTLAQCMRVSPAFNYAAAPLIYHTVKLDEDNVIGFFSFPWNSYKVQDIRKTKSKAYHLATMVRSFDCSVRDLAYCEIASRNYHSDMLCVRTPVWRAYLEASTRVQRGTIPYARVDRAPQRVLPAKLICHGPGMNDSRCILRNLYPGLKSLVMVGEIWKTARQLSPPISMLSSQSLDRLTLIHWSDWSATHRLSYDLSSYDDMPDIQHNTPKAWETFQKDILKAAQIANFPTEIIIVNTECKAVLKVQSPDLAKAATEATQEAYIKSIPEFAEKDRKKTTEQAQNVRIKFVSMRTYLDEYEWKGELTERQVKPWMDIQMDTEGREAYNQTPLSPQPTSSTRQPIPMEILRKILPHLVDNKHALAQCMQVSPTFNSIAATLLYHTIKLSGTTASLFEAPRMLNGLKESRQTRDKVFNVTNYVHILDSSGHPETGCQVRQSLSDPLIIHPRVMRVAFGNIEVRSRPSQYPCKCFGMDRISPIKLVCLGSSPSTLALPVCVDFKTAVVIREDSSLVIPRSIHKPGFRQNVNRMILIWTDSGQSVSSFVRITCGVVHAALEANCSSEFILVAVNLDNLSSCSEVLAQRQDPEEVATAVIQEEYLGRINQYAGREVIMTAEEAQEVKFKFISMKTYLAKYDWGEDLTEEQVRPWLDTEREMVAGEAEREDKV